MGATRYAGARTVKRAAINRTGPEWYSKKINEQTRTRIRLMVAALAYEKYSNPIISDAEFDRLAGEVDLSVKTRRADMDRFFVKYFNPHTGMWINSLNKRDLKRVDDIYHRYFSETKPSCRPRRRIKITARLSIRR